ncbi:MAG: DUF4760 domain-containing protein [Nitrososphaerales archaeon]
MARPPQKDVETVLRLYSIYDRNRESAIWFLSDLSEKDYESFKKKYPSRSRARAHFATVAGFFELGGLLVERKLLNEDLFFDTFNVSAFWSKAKGIIKGMRRDRPRIYENFELVSRRKIRWVKRHPPKLKRKRI